MFRSLLAITAVLSGCAAAPLPTPELAANPVVVAPPPESPTASAPIPGEPAEVTEVCAQVPCRWVPAVGQRMPYAYQGDVIIAPGESFALTGVERDGLLDEVRLLPDPQARGPKVIVAWRRTDGRPALSVTNGFPWRLRSRSMFLTSADSEFEDTDACAVAKNSAAVLTSLPPEVKLVALTSLEFVGDEAFDACEAQAQAVRPPG